MITLLCQAVDKEFYPLEGLFIITIPSTLLVGQIRDKIMVEPGGALRPPFEDFASGQLTLWKLSGSHPADDEDDEDDKDDGVFIAKSLDAVHRKVRVPELLPMHRRVSHYFAEGPPVEKLQILVQVPVSTFDRTDLLSPLQTTTCLLKILRHLKPKRLLSTK
jgi:hypothetical protein